MATGTLQSGNGTYTVTANEDVVNSIDYNRIRKAGNMVNVFFSFYPAISSLQNVLLGTLPSGVIPHSQQLITALVTLVYNQQSSTYAVPVAVDALGRIRTYNNGSYGDVRNLTTSSLVYVFGTYSMI